MNKCSCNFPLRNTSIKYLSKTARILSSKTKLRILLILLNRKHCVCEIEDCLNKEQSLISHHLSDLVEAGWIKRRQGKDARQAFYSLTKKAEKKLKIFIRLVNPNR